MRITALAWILLGQASQSHVLVAWSTASCRSRPSVHALTSRGNDDTEPNSTPLDTSRRRAVTDSARTVVSAAMGTIAATISTASSSTANANAFETHKQQQLRLVTDPSTYSALAYAPPPQQQLGNNKSKSESKPPPLLIVLHGAGKNDQTAWSLADPLGEHAGLAPSLLSTFKAPSELSDNFAVVCPYATGKQSFYEEPRSKLLQFVEWVCSDAGRHAGCPEVDPTRVFLFGFSDGATVAVELATTRRFTACVIAAYGFTGKLPALALQRLEGVPFWVFHSADDVIFPVAGSDRFVASLRGLEGNKLPNRVRYTRYTEDQEGFTGSVRGHSTGITASKLPDIYTWMLSI
jgi:predicted peptidase